MQPLSRVNIRIVLILNVENPHQTIIQFIVTVVIKSKQMALHSHYDLLEMISVNRH